MTTKKEKFEAALNKMLSQSGEELEIKETKKEKKGGYFKENITCEEDYEYDENGEKLLPLWENQEELDEFRRESAEERKRDKIREKENEKMWDDYNRKERILKGYANAVCWIALSATVFLSGWAFVLFAGLTPWDKIEGIGTLIFIPGYWILVSSMTSGYVFFFISTVVFLLGINYWRWLGNGMNPKAF